MKVYETTCTSNSPWGYERVAFGLAGESLDQNITIRDKVGMLCYLSLCSRTSLGHSISCQVVFVNSDFGNPRSAFVCKSLENHVTVLISGYVGVGCKQNLLEVVPPGCFGKPSVYLHIVKATIHRKRNQSTNDIGNYGFDECTIVHTAIVVGVYQEPNIRYTRELPV